MSDQELNLCMHCMSQLNINGECPECGAKEAKDNPLSDDLYIVPGTLLNMRYIVGESDGKSGGMISYIGYDIYKKVKVTIYELFDEGMSTRQNNSAEIVYNDEFSEEKDTIRKAFRERFLSIKNAVDEIEAVADVVDVFSENNTEYAVFLRETGIKFSDIADKIGAGFDWDSMGGMFKPLINAVMNLNEKGVIHGRINLDNIIADENGKIYLKGFASGVFKASKGKLAKEEYDGYIAPEEMDAESDSGEYTDVYSLGEVMLRIITDFDPKNGEYTKYSMIPETVAPQEVMNAISKATERRVSRRMQNAAELYEKIYGDKISQENPEVIEGVAEIEPAEEEIQNNAAKPKKKKRSKKVPEVKYVEVYEGNREYTALEVPIRKKTRRGTAYGFIALIAALIVLMFVAGGYMYYAYGKFQGKNIVLPDDISGIDLDAMAEKTALVQNFVGQYYDFIEYNIKYSEKYNITAEYDYNSNYDENFVFGQSVEAGTPIEKNKVNLVLYVSKGAKSIQMPDVVGKPLEEAEQILKDNKIEYKIFQVYDKSAAENVVIRTSIPANAKIAVEKDLVIVYARKK